MKLLEESESVSHSFVSNSLRPHGLEPARLLCPWDSPGTNTVVISHSLLQGIFPSQGLNLCLPHCRQILYHLSHQGSPKRQLLLICDNLKHRQQKKKNVLHQEEKLLFFKEHYQ